nr:hypothetical protein [Tanacetum cinerariifolium]
MDVKAANLEASAMDKERELTNLNVHLTAVKSQNDVLVDQVHELEVSSAEMTLHFEEKFYPHLLTTIFGRRWLLTHGMKPALVNCLHSPEYLSALRSTVGKAIEKENPLAKKLGLTELQPYVDKLMVHIHHSPDKVVVGAFTISLDVDISSIRTSNVMPTTADTTTALSTTFASASTIAPISVDDYEVMGTDDQAGADGIADPFSNVDDAEMNIPQSIFTVFSVDMPISAGMIASVLYVNEKEVSPLLDFIMAAIFSFHQTISLWVLNRSKVLANT